MKPVSLLLICWLLAGALPAQRAFPDYGSPGWDVLTDVKYQKRTHKGVEMYWPVLPANVKAQHEKPLRLKGYVVTMEAGTTHKRFYLSMLPESDCFFCGGGGPDTIVEVQSEHPVKYGPKPITLEGILLVNDKDPEQMLYRLVRARQVF